MPLANKMDGLEIYYDRGCKAHYDGFKFYGYPKQNTFKKEKLKLGIAKLNQDVSFI